MGGRKFLTIVAGIVFAYAVWAKILPPEAVATLLSMVFTLYFTRDRSNEEGK
uniref:Uncharacterized protein n=1 Tax=viral metagenome TaxID=1070528 RepID=A0A6M3J4J8_9ZZZZ